MVEEEEEEEETQGQLNDDAIEEILKKADVPMLCKLKGVSRAGGLARGECSGHGCACKAGRCPRAVPP